MQPCSYVALSISCSGLRNADFVGKSDPMVVVFAQENGRFSEVGRTEVIKDCLNPDFVTQIKIPYFFETQQTLRFVVVDVDSPQKPLSSQDQLGELEVTLARIVAASGSVYSGPLILKGKPRGSLTCRADEVLECKQALEIQFAANKLDNKDGWFGKSDPFLVISRRRVDGSFIPVHQTEVVMDNCDPIWKTFSVSLTTLCNALVDEPIVIECYDWDSDGSRDFIGGLQTTTRSLIEMNPANFALTNPKKKKNQGISGTLKILSSRLIVESTFLDYIVGGCEVSLNVAIDFTASNNPPQDPRSLHHISASGNAYESALWAVGSVLLPYDSDGLINMSGFGAKINGVANHYFPITPPTGVRGIEGVIGAYRNVLSVGVELWGPTNFAPTIREAARTASQMQTQQDQKYFVLLIVTDGVITDLDLTKTEIIRASVLPLSIVIVGVGNADFTAMNELDSDSGLLRHQGQVAKRDIVQFVAFNAVANSREELARQTLREIPGQMLSFFKLAGFVPNPPRPPPVVYQPPPPQQVQPQESQPQAPPAQVPAPTQAPPQA
eukprot:c25381_g1_i1.p1 GENE.c25381_g1_i1~~c25381_g1_i1.p1  ORF type:complete len:553 (+),score=122.76 c25381_g1_i1:34-1692(+)